MQRNKLIGAFIYIYEIYMTLVSGFFFASLCTGMIKLLEDMSGQPPSPIAYSMAKWGGLVIGIIIGQLHFFIKDYMNLQEEDE